MVKTKKIINNKHFKNIRKTLIDVVLVVTAWVIVWRLEDVLFDKFPWLTFIFGGIVILVWSCPPIYRWLTGDDKPGRKGTPDTPTGV